MLFVEENSKFIKFYKNNLRPPVGEGYWTTQIEATASIKQMSTPYFTRVAFFGNPMIP